jgi:hypothetical protein
LIEEVYEFNCVWIEPVNVFIDAVNAFVEPVYAFTSALVA